VSRGAPKDTDLELSRGENGRERLTQPEALESHAHMVGRPSPLRDRPLASRRRCWSTVVAPVLPMEPRTIRSETEARPRIGPFQVTIIMTGRAFFRVREREIRCSILGASLE
jgi:hypothetical protein